MRKATRKATRTQRSKSRRQKKIRGGKPGDFCQRDSVCPYPFQKRTRYDSMHKWGKQKMVRVANTFLTQAWCEKCGCVTRYDESY